MNLPPTPKERLRDAMMELLAAIQEIPPKANGFRLHNAYDAVLEAVSSENAAPQSQDGRGHSTAGSSPATAVAAPVQSNDKRESQYIAVIARAVELLRAQAQLMFDGEVNMAGPNEGKIDDEDYAAEIEEIRLVAAQLETLRAFDLSPLFVSSSTVALPPRETDDWLDKQLRAVHVDTENRVVHLGYGVYNQLVMRAFAESSARVEPAWRRLEASDADTPGAEYIMWRHIKPSVTFWTMRQGATYEVTLPMPELPAEQSSYVKLCEPK